MPEVLEAVKRLEERRQLLQRAAETLSISGINANSFENVGRIIGEFCAQVLRVYMRTPFPDLPEGLELLRNCARGLLVETEMTQRREQARNFCRNAARLVAEALPGMVPAPEATPPPLLGSTAVAETYKSLGQRRPNVATAMRALDKLEAQGVDVAEARDAREEYRELMRSDYGAGAEGSEEYRGDREEAWDRFLETLSSTEEPEISSGFPLET